MATGGPPRKSALSSQQKAPARPSAAAAAMAVAAAEEERLLRQRNRLTLEDDKPDAERCLEELVFGDVEDDEDALLRRLRGPPVQVHEDSGDSEVENEAKGDLPRKKPVWVDEEDEDEEMVDMVNNRFRKDMMKNASESKLSKDKLQKRLKEEFQHAMGAYLPGQRIRSGKHLQMMKVKMKMICCKGLEISYPHQLLFQEES